jgi:hypothetical protein
MITCGVTVYRCPVTSYYSFSPCSAPPFATHDDVSQGWFRDSDTALNALLATDPSWESFAASVYQALWMRGDRPLSYDEHTMMHTGPGNTGPAPCWETRVAWRRRGLGPLSWAGPRAGQWRWDGTWTRTCQCTPPELVDGDLQAGDVWLCACRSAWKWEPDA